MSDRPSDLERAAWSWTRHLRAGGVTTWSDWIASPRASQGPSQGPSQGSSQDASALVPPGWSVPGAAQLELVRLLAGREPRPGLDFPALADRVMGRSAPGRGLGQQPLTWPFGSTEPGRQVGTPPADPSRVAVEELVRVGVGVLCDLLLDVADRTRVPVPPRRPLLVRRPAFVLDGAPVTASAVRLALASAGHVEGGRSPVAVLVATPLDDLLAQVWSARVQGGAAVRWPGFARRWARRAALPPAADLPALVRMWADRLGPEQVHVVVVPRGPGAVQARAVHQTARVLGIEAGPMTGARRLLGPRGVRDQWGIADLAPAAVDVARRVNAVLDVRVSAAQRPGIQRALVTRLSPDQPAGRALTVPEPLRGWVTSCATQMADDLTSGRYPVHGRAEDLVPRFVGLPTRPRRVDTLDVVVNACLAQAERNQHLGEEEA